MVLNLHAQMAPVGQWKNHSAYSQAQQVVHTKDKIYCVTTGALFAVNLNDNSYETLSDTGRQRRVQTVCVLIQSYGHKDRVIRLLWFGCQIRERSI